MLSELVNLFSENRNCRKCFNNPQIIKSGEMFAVSDVKGPQPRWVGENYFNSKQRICFVLINPGSGDKTPDNEWSSLPNLSLGKNMTIRTSAWQDLMKTNEKGMEKWGSWKSLYIDTFGFEDNLDEICFTNWMLCAAKYKNSKGKFENAYNTKSIETCFSNVSNRVLSNLSPDIIIFSGGFSIDAAVKKPISLTERRNKSGNKSREISSFEIKKEVKDCLAKKTRYFYMGHYAYIKSEDYLDAKIIKDQIAV
mgnify:FL=1